MTKISARLHFVKTSEKIKKYIINELPHLLEEKEIDAVVTHFLDSPNACPPLLAKEDYFSLFQYLVALAHASKLSNKKGDNLLVHEYDSNSTQHELELEFTDIPSPAPKEPKFTFIDLFAGIGGFRQAMQSVGGKCVFSSEWDKYAQQTYAANYGEIPFGDIREIDAKEIPDHDVLCAGFPCQAFSIAGKRKGFEETRGTLFFEVARIIKEKQPKAFFLENVKGLISHNKGQTLKKILKVLRGDKGNGYLDYYVPDPQVLNAKDFGVPQNRERIFIVGFRKDVTDSGFEYPLPLNTKAQVSDILEEKEVSVKYYLSETYLQTLKDHKARHAGKGNGFGYQIIDQGGISNAIVCGGMGRERNLVVDNRISDYTPVTHIKGKVSRENIRRMTPREWARLQGYSDNFVIPVSDAQAFKQFGNSVAVPAITAMAKKIINKGWGN